jgi:hypothetical protein
VPTIIDSLILEFGLDPAKFTQGQKQITEALTRTKADADRQAKEIEASGKQAARFFSEMRKTAVELFALFTGGRGIKDFIQDTVTAGVHLGQLSKILGMSGRDIAAWQGVAERVGGSSESITNLMKNLNGQLQELSLTGESGKAIAFFRSLGVDVGMFGKPAKTADDILLQLADHVKEFSELDTRRAAQIFHDLGANDGDIALLLRSGDAIRKLLDEEKRLAGWTQPQIDASDRLRDRWNLLWQVLDNLWRIIQTNLEPAVRQLLDALIQLGAWLEQHPKILEGVFVAAAIVLTRLTLGIGTGLVGAIGIATGKANLLGSALQALSITGLLGQMLRFYNLLQVVEAIGSAKPEDFKEDRSKAEGIWNRLFGGTFLEDKTQPGESWLRNLLFGHKSVPASPGWTSDRGRSQTPSGAISGAMTPAEAAAYIRQAAIKRGIDPEVALRVAESEGGFAGRPGDYGGGSQPSSFTPFQLHYGGIAPGMMMAGLGDEFTKRTGLDARDPVNERAAIDFALDQAAHGGWGPWHGWKGTPFAGITPPSAVASTAGAGGAASTTTVTTQNHIGEVNVHTQATDADGIAKDIRAAIDRNATSSQANMGAQ